MANARDAKDWAKEHLRGVCDSLYTPYNGRDGDEIDYEAVRFLVRYCLSDLDHAGLWITGGCGEFWALTMDERKRMVEVQIEEARRVKPTALLQVESVTLSAKDTVELTLHAQNLGADICFIQNPFMEAHGAPGTLEFFRYVADRTDIALGMFNSPCSGFTMTPAECAMISREIPAVCANKDPAPIPAHHGVAFARLAPDCVTWGCDDVEYNAGLLQQGLAGPCIMGAMPFIGETPSDRRYSEWFNLILEGKIDEAREQFYRTGVDIPGSHGLTYTSAMPERPGYTTHWASASKYAASLLGLPVGDHPYSRPPQIRLSDAQKQRIDDAYARSGLLH